MNARHSCYKLWGIYKEEPYTYPILKEGSSRKKLFIEDKVESGKCHRRGNVKF